MTISDLDLIERLTRLNNMDLYPTPSYLTSTFATSPARRIAQRDEARAVLRDLFRQGAVRAIRQDDERIVRLIIPGRPLPDGAAPLTWAPPPRPQNHPPTPPTRPSPPDLNRGAPMTITDRDLSPDPATYLAHDVNIVYDPNSLDAHQARHHHPLAGDRVITPEGWTGKMRGAVYGRSAGEFTWLYATLELDRAHAHLTLTGLIEVSYLDLKLAPPRPRRPRGLHPVRPDDADEGPDDPG
jgi:hypothetical protein